MKKFKIDYSFILFILLLFFSPKQSSLLIVMVSLIFHELGHISLILLFRYPIETLRLSLFGFSLKLKETQQFFYKDFLIYSGGIFVNLFIFLVVPNYEVRQIQFFLILLNILPIYPLDGFNIFKTLLSYFFPFFYTLWFTSILGVLSAIGILILCFIFKADLCLWFSFTYLLVLNLWMLFHFKKRYRYFLLRKKLYPYSYPKKICNFKENFFHYFYFYHEVDMRIGRKVITQKELLEKTLS